jgi:hypothetical protein
MSLLNDGGSMNPPLDWLLQGEPWVAYRARLDLLGEAETAAAREQMLTDPNIKKLLGTFSEWPGKVVNSHKSAGLLYHRLAFAADLGLTIREPEIDAVCEHILARQSDEGPFQVPVNIPTHFGGSGQDTWGWALCDTPVLTYSLVKFGLGDDPRTQKAIATLTGLVRQNGWPCAVSPELGKFRGPGRKDDPCPYANLVMLKLLAEIPAQRDSQSARIGAETLLNLWEKSREQHPYIFYMGDDFRKLKVPFVWYDLIHVLDVLSRFPWLKDDLRLADMLTVLKSKADAEGRFTLESVWMAWKEWEFGQKKVPSRWLTLLAWRIFQRLESF